MHKAPFACGGCREGGDLASITSLASSAAARCGWRWEWEGSILFNLLPLDRAGDRGQLMADGANAWRQNTNPLSANLFISLKIDRGDQRPTTTFNIQPST